MGPMRKAMRWTTTGAAVKKSCGSGGLHKQPSCRWTNPCSVLINAASVLGDLMLDTETWLKGCCRVTQHSIPSVTVCRYGRRRCDAREPAESHESSPEISPSILRFAGVGIRSSGAPVMRAQPTCMWVSTLLVINGTAMSCHCLPFSSSRPISPWIPASF